MKPPEKPPKKVKDDALLAEAIRLAGGPGRLAALLGTVQSNVNRFEDAIPRHWWLVLRWYVATGGQLEPPAEIAALGAFREFASVVGGHKQLRKVVLALAETEDERKMFDDAMTAAEK